MKLTDEQRDFLTALQEGGEDFTLDVSQHGLAYDLQDMGLVVFHAHANLVAVTGKGKWPTWAIEHFPDDPQSAREWQPITWRYPLHRQVMVVATTRIEGAWKAYCAPVPGISHDQEEGPVLDHGCDIGERVALVLFPHMKGIPYAG